MSGGTATLRSPRLLKTCFNYVIRSLVSGLFKKARPTLEVSPQFKRRIVLPLEGKGDRSAVDEVTCGPAPFREAFLADARKSNGTGSVVPDGESLAHVQAR